MKTLNTYRLRGQCDECDADKAIADYPQGDGPAQPQGVAKRMADIWNKQHEENTGHTKGHVKVLRDPIYPYDAGSTETFRPTGGKEGEKGDD